MPAPPPHPSTDQDAQPFGASADPDPAQERACRADQALRRLAGLLARQVVADLVARSGGGDATEEEQTA